MKKKYGNPKAYYESFVKELSLGYINAFWINKNTIIEYSYSFSSEEQYVGVNKGQSLYNYNFRISYENINYRKNLLLLEKNKIIEEEREIRKQDSLIKSRNQKLDKNFQEVI